MNEYETLVSIVRELVRITTYAYPDSGESMEDTLARLKREPPCLQSSEDYWKQKLS